MLFAYNTFADACTIIAEPCSSPVICDEGERFADQADCEYYWECQGGELVRLQCISGLTDQCNLPGIACAFDTTTQLCIAPGINFDCANRCPEQSNPKTGRDT